MVYCTGKLIESLKKLFHKSNRPHFLWVYRRNKLGERKEVGRTRACKHAPSAGDLKAFLVFSQHPAWVTTPENPQKVWSIAQ